MAARIRHALRLIKHQAYDFSRVVGLRDRLRCPECHAVGTWKPHGGWLDVLWGGDTAAARRWLCKWCGLYRGVSTGTFVEAHAGICQETGVWRVEAFPTPKDFVHCGLGPVDPWRG